MMKVFLIYYEISRDLQHLHLDVRVVDPVATCFASAPVAVGQVAQQGEQGRPFWITQSEIHNWWVRCKVRLTLKPNAPRVMDNNRVLVHNTWRSRAYAFAHKSSCGHTYACAHMCAQVHAEKGRDNVCSMAICT